MRMRACARSSLSQSALPIVNGSEAASLCELPWCQMHDKEATNQLAHTRTFTELPRAIPRLRPTARPYNFASRIQLASARTLTLTRAVLRRSCSHMHAFRNSLGVRDKITTMV